MTLWNNTDANTSAPIFAPMQVQLAPTQTNLDTLYENTTQDGIIAGEAVGVFGVSSDEKTSTGNVAVINVLTTGTGFTARPTVAVTGANTVAAVATAVGVVVGATVAAAGTGYANNEVITLDGTGTAANLTVTNVNANGNVLSVSISNVGAYTTLPTLTLNSGSANTSANGVGFTANVSIGLGPITVTTIGEQYVAPVVTIGGAGGVGATASPVLTGQEGSGVTHTGWNLRTEGSGGRAGRVFYETLVAGDITSDGADDAQLAP
jgi:hypothetical protein